MQPTVAELKRRAAVAAVEFVESGMVLGLGAGSTALKALERIAERIAAGDLSGIVGVPCSESVAAAARRLGVPLTDLDAHPIIDLTIDGADEVDPQLRVIKGGGGALLREKIVAQASRREIIIVDPGKLSPALGRHWAVPIEVVPFGWRTHEPFLRELGGVPRRRTSDDGKPYRTDSGNFILDCAFGPIQEPEGLAAALSARAGVVEHGLFLGLVTDLIVAYPDRVQHHRIDEGRADFRDL